MNTESTQRNASEQIVPAAPQKVEKSLWRGRLAIPIAIGAIAAISLGILFAVKPELNPLNLGNVLHIASPYIISGGAISIIVSGVLVHQQRKINAISGVSKETVPIPKLTLEETLQNIPLDEIWNKEDPKVHLKQQFYELIRRGFKTAKERIELYKKLDDISDSQIQNLKSALNKHAWSDSIFINELKEVPNIALAAVRKGEISVFDFDFIMSHWNAKNYFKKGTRVVSLFINDEINPEALSLIKQTFVTNGYFNNGEVVTNEQLIEMCKRWKALPKSQQQILLIPQITGRWYEGDTISEHLSKIGMNLFRFVKSNGNDLQMIPSLGILQTFLDIKFGSNDDEKLGFRAVKINPVIGLSSLEDIENNGLFKTRDVCIPFPGVDIPSEADGLSAPPLAFHDHDLYHCYISSLIHAGHAQAFIHLANAVKAKINSNEISKRGYLYPNFLLDMENFVYDPLRRPLGSEINPKLSRLFFKTLEFMLERNDYFDGGQNNVVRAHLLIPEDMKSAWKDEFSIITN